MEVVIGIGMIVLGIAVLAIITILIEQNTEAYEDALRKQIHKDLR
jgi:hypothetical protein